jgi:hypothetical protein
MSNLKLEPNRIIEIARFGRFYVMGAPKFVVLPIIDPLNTNRGGSIIIEEKISVESDPHKLNVLFRIPNKGGNLIPVLFKNQEMAEEVCYACNRIKV